MDFGIRPRPETSKVAASPALRQAVRDGLDLSRDHLDTVAAELNGRPRETLGWDTPAERFTGLLAETS